jgi:hypothetical protein
MNERSGETIRRIVTDARNAKLFGWLSEEQSEWSQTFLTLPPSAESLREAAA